MTQAERLLYMAEKGYEYGVKTKLDVDDAQLNLVQARGNLARSKRDYLVALGQFRVGEGDPGGAEVSAKLKTERTRDRKKA